MKIVVNDLKSTSRAYRSKVQQLEKELKKP
jgi:hypothetical protein